VLLREPAGPLAATVISLVLYASVLVLTRPYSSREHAIIERATGRHIAVVFGIFTRRKTG
jgi:hypothetical protein